MCTKLLVDYGHVGDSFVAVIIPFAVELFGRYINCRNIQNLSTRHFTVNLCHHFRKLPYCHLIVRISHVENLTISPLWIFLWINCMEWLYLFSFLNIRIDETEKWIQKLIFMLTIINITASIASLMYIKVLWDSPPSTSFKGSPLKRFCFKKELYVVCISYNSLQL